MVGVCVSVFVAFIFFIMIMPAASDYALSCTLHTSAFMMFHLSFSCCVLFSFVSPILFSRLVDASPSIELHLLRTGYSFIFFLFLFQTATTTKSLKIFKHKLCVFAWACSEVPQILVHRLRIVRYIPNRRERS